ncbi:PTS sugar transporter subunit IIB [Lactobacillus sp. M0403]|uniref:PTS system mannose/fructose/N-acetylgalactosamine-transporter subunit IIB n=1 Tax=unclassified Lactobacillus TaxID=2620435 RepID=UPI000EFBA5C9|nr:MULTISPECIES: PTS sugar transporter subunit IIB [unclassified Lactobacillus]MBI0092204.1 PTS sugar transporter subunit IIB [Lactobacillus sp. M0403]RMC48351.1 PTS mannose/fructose/sorbose transporter subunit IIB [Lactobacillus sp. ESL0263]
MEGIIHIRIDDRLIHGQVATLWTNELGATRIMVINDEVANNEIQKTMLRMAAPSNVSTSLITEEKAVNNINNGNYKGQKVLVIVKNPETVVRLMDQGLDIKKINVGNMSTRENTHHIKPSVSITPEEEQAFRVLLDRGVEITAVMVPTDKMVYLKDLI